MKVIENFLPEDFFNKLQKLITVDDFPWFLRTTMVENSNDYGYFTYSFFNANNVYVYVQIWETTIRSTKKIIICQYSL